MERYGALSASVGDEGGFAPDLADVAEALELIMVAIEASGHRGAVSIALDVAASELAVRLAARPAVFLRTRALAYATGPPGVVVACDPVSLASPSLYASRDAVHDPVALRRRSRMLRAKLSSLSSTNCHRKTMPSRQRSCLHCIR